MQSVMRQRNSSAVDTSSEEWRRECEARWVLKNLPVANKPRARIKKTTRREYIEAVERQRGKEAADQLKADIKKEWQLQKER